MAWHGYVAIAFEEIIELATKSPVVARRLLAALDDLIAFAPADRRPPLEAQRSQLLAGAGEDAMPLVADVQGFGASADLMVTP